MRAARTSMLAALALASVLAPACDTPRSGDTQAPLEAASAFGAYERDSIARFDEWRRSSQYVTMVDGTRLAVDLVRPAIGGQPVEEPLPTVWLLYRYQRATVREGEVRSVVESSASLRDLVRHGYNVVVVDTRGSGASFGIEQAPHSVQEAGHAREITDWIAAQPWSDGQVGMYGHSHGALMAYLAASRPSPHLKAVFASMGSFDLYDFVYPGGVFREPLMRMWGDYVRDLDTNGAVAPVDEDADGNLLAAAMAEHRRAPHTADVMEAFPYRDSRLNGSTFWRENNPAAHLAGAREGAVPMYHWSGWMDLYVGHQLLWFTNLDGPHKLTIGPWSHASSDPERSAERSRLLRVEMLRWFDRWLKGVENGVDREPRLNFAVIHEPDRWTWEQLDAWEASTGEEVLYFASGPVGGALSVNDGALGAEGPTRDEAADAYTVDFTATSGQSSRWYSGWGEADLRPNDAKALTYTSEPLERDVLVLGHPVATLFLAASTPDADVFVYLEEVDEAGASRYVTEGTLRASHRVLAEPPFDNLGLPWHPSTSSGAEPLEPGRIAELKIVLIPTANLFDRGHRIRVSVTGADADNAQVPPRGSAPVIRLYRTRTHASRIALPVRP